MHKSFLYGESIPVKTGLVVSNTQLTLRTSNPGSLDPVDKSLNHATIAADWAHSHRPHEKGRRERGKSDFQGSGQPDKGLWNSTASGQNHMTLAHRKSPKLSIVWDSIKIPQPPHGDRGPGRERGERTGGGMGEWEVKEDGRLNYGVFTPYCQQQGQLRLDLTSCNNYREWDLLPAHVTCRSFQFYLHLCQRCLFFLLWKGLSCKMRLQEFHEPLAIWLSFECPPQVASKLEKHILSTLFGHVTFILSNCWLRCFIEAPLHLLSKLSSFIF